MNVERDLLLKIEAWINNELSYSPFRVTLVPDDSIFSVVFLLPENKFIHRHHFIEVFKLLNQSKISESILELFRVDITWSNAGNTFWITNTL